MQVNIQKSLELNKFLFKGLESINLYQELG